MSMVNCIGLNFILQRAKTGSMILMVLCFMTGFGTYSFNIIRTLPHGVRCGGGMRSVAIYFTGNSAKMPSTQTTWGACFQDLLLLIVRIPPGSERMRYCFSTLPMENMLSLFGPLLSASLTAPTMARHGQSMLPTRSLGGWRRIIEIPR